jgi:hypothetical protein
MSTLFADLSGLLLTLVLRLRSELHPDKQLQTSAPGKDLVRAGCTLRNPWGDREGPRLPLPN